jgi:cytochrome P450
MRIVEHPSLTLLGEPDVVANPYPVLAALRAASPYTAIDDALVVLGRHADCSRILRDPGVSSERGRSRLVPPDSNRRFGMSFLSMDPPDHTRLRRLVAKAFTPRVIAALAPRIREVTGELLATAAARDPHELEVVSQLAYPLPVRIICELLGVPAEDQHRFAGWSARLAHSLQPRFMGNDDEQVADAAAARIEFADYFRELVAQRRAQPGDDLLTELIRAEDEGSRLTEAELLATSILLLVISNAVLALLRHPDQLAALRDDPGLAGDTVEETLRYDPPVQLTARVARDEIQIGDVTATDGAVILVLLAATGRDPEVFPEPDRFDITRPAGGHLAFAAGPHFCLGAPLARLEASIAVTAFARQLTRPALDGLSYKPNFNLRGPERLVVRTAGIRPAV